MQSRRLLMNERYKLEESAGIHCLRLAFAFSILASLIAILGTFDLLPFVEKCANFSYLRNPLIIFLIVDLIVLILMFGINPPFQFSTLRMFAAAGFFAYASYCLFDDARACACVFLAFCCAGFLNLRIPVFLSFTFFAIFVCALPAWFFIIF